MNPFGWFRRNNEFDDEPDVSIIDALNKQPPPYGGDVTAPIMHIPPRPDPPSRQARPELHVTGPQRARPYINGVIYRPSPGQMLRASRATLPVFRETSNITGWGAFIPRVKPSAGAGAIKDATSTGAFRSIEAYSDKTIRRICQQAEACRAELWERARDYDMMEAERRLRRPLTSQRGM